MRKGGPFFFPLKIFNHEENVMEFRQTISTPIACIPKPFPLPSKNLTCVSQCAMLQDPILLAL